MTKKVQNGAVSGLVFDVTGITAKQTAELNQARQQTRLRDEAAVMAQFATACPPEWGPVNEGSTYSRLPLTVIREVRNVFVRQVNAVIEEAAPPEGLDFDVEAISGEDVEDFLKANREFDVEVMSDLMAKYVTNWPEAWGDCDADTFAELGAGPFRQAVQLFVERMTDLTKN